MFMGERLRHLFSGFRDTTMLLTLTVWLCVVPFVLLFTLPFFGWTGGVTAAVLSFLLALAACYGICLFPKSAEEVTAHARRSRVR